MWVTKKVLGCYRGPEGFGLENARLVRGNWSCPHWGLVKCSSFPAEVGKVGQRLILGDHTLVVTDIVNGLCVPDEDDVDYL